MVSSLYTDIPAKPDLIMQISPLSTILVSSLETYSHTNPELIMVFSLETDIPANRDLIMLIPSLSNLVQYFTLYITFSIPYIYIYIYPCRVCQSETEMNSSIKISKDFPWCDDSISSKINFPLTPLIYQKSNIHQYTKTLHDITT